ncbi:hypothetical protein [Luteolibacter sp. Populi]|uniref:hypothetical protein n=1 Tax=Luteolibacter sp. Populi TaxID=3230487 RepID=UPI003464F4B9
MFDSTSLQGALERGRREQVPALPVDFSAGVIERLAGPAAMTHGIFRSGVVIACAAVFTAVAVSFVASAAEDRSGPPPLEVFGAPAAHSPFATP